MSGRSIAIIGAGISGIATAKACLEAGLRPFVFEQSPSLGGMWSPESTLLRQSMRVNSSRHTCSFSDQAWSIKHMFPNASEVGDYLVEYARRFLRHDTISFGHRITNVKRVNSRWQLTWETKEDSGESSFDSLVVASGYFSETFTPDIPGLSGFPGRVIHSSEYRFPEEISGKRIAIVGDSFSGIELAGEIGLHASSLTHIHSHPFWIFPKILPLRPSDAFSPFAPIDLTFYSRAARKSPGENALPDIESIRSRNRYFRTIAGDQSLLAPDLGVPVDESSWVTISDNYANSVRAGVINTKRGRLSSIQNGHLVLNDGEEIFEDFDVIIMATGFRPSLPFLDDATLTNLSYDSQNLHTAFLLHRITFNPSIPDAAFVGMYRGPYMGVIELQARWVAKVFSGQLALPSPGVQAEGIALEEKIRTHVPRTQFPHSDYPGLMTDFASELGINPLEMWPGRNIDLITPAQFNLGEVPSQQIARVEQDLADAERGKWVAGAVYSALQGPWKITRRLESFNSTLPSGTFRGQASFTRRVPVNPTPTSPEWEYGYLEKGQLTTDAGQQFEAQRKYRYVYDEEEDRIDAYFDDASNSGFFHSLRFLPPGEERNEEIGADWGPWVGEPRKGWCAVGDHLCRPDTYTAAYWFAFSGVHLDEFRISYRVKGPNKDYIATATFTRE